MKYVKIHNIDSSPLYPSQFRIVREEMFLSLTVLTGGYAIARVNVDGRRVSLFMSPAHVNQFFANNPEFAEEL